MPFASKESQSKNKSLWLAWETWLLNSSLSYKMAHKVLFITTKRKVSYNKPRTSKASIRYLRRTKTPILPETFQKWPIESDTSPKFATV